LRQTKTGAGDRKLLFYFQRAKGSCQTGRSPTSPVSADIGTELAAN
jgi:hypothetical protein